MKKAVRFLALVTVLIVMPAFARAQVHPSKMIYGDAESWPVIAPDAIDFASGFQPFRAVWSREYRNTSGEMRTDRVVLVAEELSWYGRPVISLTFHDAGSPEVSDTNARTTEVYLDRQTLSLVRATAPRAGTAEDYVVVTVRDGVIRTTSVAASTGAAETTAFSIDTPVFGSFNLDFLIWAGLGLREGTRAVTRLYPPGGNGFVPSIIRVLNAEEVELPGGERVRAWVVERPIRQLDNGRMHHFRILDRPPYMLSRHVIDLDTGETSFHARLIEWQLLGNN